MTEIENDLRPCRTCGPAVAVRLTWIRNDQGTIQHYGYCWMCGAEGSKHTDEIMAVSAWNQRTAALRLAAQEAR